MTIDRQCSSGLMAIASAAKQVIVAHMDVTVAGGVESITMVQTSALRTEPDPGLLALVPDIYLPIVQTSETVAKRYGIQLKRHAANGDRKSVGEGARGTIRVDLCSRGVDRRITQFRN